MAEAHEHARACATRIAHMQVQEQVLYKHQRKRKCKRKGTHTNKHAHKRTLCTGARAASDCNRYGRH
eukprot:2271951-Alexandrium_andersonii.AAC.1